MADRIWFTSPVHTLPIHLVSRYRDLGVTPVLLPAASSRLSPDAWNLVGVSVAADAIAARPTVIAHFDFPSKSIVDFAAQTGAELWTFLHTEATSEIVDYARSKNVKLVPLDATYDDRGERIFGAIGLTGRNGVRFGLAALNLTNPRAVVLGAGRCACAAIREFFHCGIACEVPPKAGMREWLLKNLPTIDILVSGADISTSLRGIGYLVRRSDLALMRRGSVIVDLIVDLDHLGAIESCVPTRGNSPYYEVDGIIHTCQWGWPDLTPDEASNIYFEQFLDVYRKVRRS